MEGLEAQFGRRRDPDNSAHTEDSSSWSKRETSRVARIVQLVKKTTSTEAIAGGREKGGRDKKVYGQNNLAGH